MARFPNSRDAKGLRQFPEELQTWDSLKQVIVASSGFQRWQLERLTLDAQLHELSLDQQVSLYLRETLETLAY